MAFLDETGLAHFWNQILARLNKFVPAESGKGLSTNDYTTEEKEKLAGIEEGANKTTVDTVLSSTSTNPVQNKVINTKLDSVQASIDGKVDSVEGKGLSTEDYTTEEKNKLARIESGANNYSLPVATSDTLGGIKSGTDITIDGSGNVSVNDDSHNHVIANIDGLKSTLDGKVDKVEGKDLSTNDLTGTLKSNYDVAYTHSQQPHAPANAEVNVIVGIQKNGTDLTVDSNKKVNITVPTKISDLTNDSNFATTTNLDSKVDKVTGKGLSTNDYTDVEKAKLASIEKGANNTVVDAALSSTSENPVQNKAINAKLTTMQADIDSRVPSSRTVNGKALSANITLSASDVGALPDTTVIPSIDGLATETYVDNKVAGLVDSAPETLNTLNELAAALGDDPNFATTVATQIGTKVDKVDGKGLSTNDYTTTEKTKLASIADNAEVNQNAFSSIIVGSTTISSDSKTDALTLAAGDNVTISADVNNDKITISAVDTVYTHPSYESKSAGLYKVTVDNTGHVSATTTVTKDDITSLGIPAQDTTYSTGTSTISGLTKLYTTTGANTDGTMTQGAITSALNDKVDPANGQYAVTTGGDGAAYTATVPGITTLTAGVSFIMIPHVVSTTTSPTLNVNGLGAKNIKRRLTSLATAAQNGYTASWLSVGLPFRVVYDGTQWIVEGHDKPAGADLYGAASKAIADASGNVITDTYATIPTKLTVTLSASDWDSRTLTQTVTASGVLADETAQFITVTPTLVSQTAYYEAGILCTDQAADSLTFTYKTAPTEDLTVYVIIIDIGS